MPPSSIEGRLHSSVRRRGTLKTVLGVDIGTYEAKGVLVDEAGHIVASTSRPHGVLIPRPGQMEHDPEAAWWDGFVAVTRHLLDATDAEVHAVAVSGIGPCVLPLDDNDQPLRNAILYGVDTRAQAQIERLNDALGPDEIYQRCGTRLTAQSAGPKVLWIEDNEPSVFARTARFATCQTFLVGRLTGRWVMDHATAAYFHPFYDQRRLDWRLDGMPTAMTRRHFPDLGWSTDVAGPVTERAAAATGLPAGIPVLTGASDAPAEALSAGIHDVGDTMVMYGSSHFIIQVVNGFHPSRQLWPAPYVLTGKRLVAAGTSTAGSFIRWYADLLAPDGGSGPDLYSDLAARALASPPGARGLLALPYLSGERTPLHDPDARGALLGLSLEHNRGDVARAIVESIAHSAAAALRCFAAEGLPPQRIVAVGGGTKNPAWVQAFSDITGFDQHIAAGPGAAYGDAILAALGIGLIARPDDIATWLRPADTVVARSEFSDLYAHQRRLFDQFYTATRSIVSELGRTNVCE